MLIVSQDKEAIHNFDNIISIQIEGSDLIVYDELQDYTALGRYETKERAKEVLKEIIKEFKKVGLKINRENTMQTEFYNLPKVYYMPEN